MQITFAKILKLKKKSIYTNLGNVLEYPKLRKVFECINYGKITYILQISTNILSFLTNIRNGSKNSIQLEYYMDFYEAI